MDTSQENYTYSTLKEIKDFLRYECFNLPQGKLIRSRLGIELLNLLNIKFNDQYKRLFLAIEMVHNASLLHDDVIDNETQRRGKISSNIVHGNKCSILMGNLILTKSLKIINDLNIKEIHKIFYDTIEDMCDGELEEIKNATKIQSIEEYIKIIELKTASLFIAIAKCILVLSHVNNENIVEFCKNYGIAFQIKNDLEDYKNKNADKKNGIYTAPYIYEEKAKNKNHSIEKTISLTDNYIRKAKNSLDCIEDNDAKNRLIEALGCLKH